MIWYPFEIETAVNIGYSCQLLTDDLIDVFVVDGSTQDEVEKQLIKFKESVKIVNTFHPKSKFYSQKLIEFEIKCQINWIKISKFFLIRNAT